MQSKSRVHFVLAAVLLMLAGVSGAFGQTKAFLNFGPGVNTGLTCPDGSTDAALGCGLAPNPTPVNQLNVYFNREKEGYVEKFALIIGIPAMGNTPTAPNIALVETYNPYPLPPGTDPVVSAQGWAPNFCGIFDDYVQNPYEICGIGGADSGGNVLKSWLIAAHALGLNPKGFALFVYWLDVPTLEPSGAHHIVFDGSVDIGTMEIAWGCGGNECYSTSFEQAGQATPEPSTFLLIAGAGLVFLGRLRWRKNSRA